MGLTHNKRGLINYRIKYTNNKNI
uniref:Uncharacterized protein n=1 Tax=Heterorhabditis bacteriophora TaxID=37862 RepID=A0A1I7WWS5_HETBA